MSYFFFADLAINNYRSFLEFVPQNDPDGQCKELIRCLRKQYTSKACGLIDKDEKMAWKNWLYVAHLREGGSVKLNVLHVAIIMQNSPLIDCILKSQANNDFLHNHVEPNEKSEEADQEVKWIYGATVLHLAARYFASCIPKLLEKLNGGLIDDVANDAQMTPLHVSAMSSNTVSTRILIENDCKVREAKDKLNRSPLFYAAKYHNYGDAMLLVWGDCDIFEADDYGQKPFQVANSKIMEFFISRMRRMSIEVLLEKDSQLEVYEEIVKNHPKLIQSFLDIFITSNNKEGTLKFDLSLFTTGTGSYFNMMHRHRFLIEKNQKEHLLHPLMLGFTEIKWRSYLQRFIPMTIFIFMFMAFFSWHCFTYSDLTGCSNDTSCAKHSCRYVPILIRFKST